MNYEKEFPEGAHVILAKEKFEPETRKEMVSMDKPHQVTPDIEVLPAHLAVPGMGFLPVNAFVKGVFGMAR